MTQKNAIGLFDSGVGGTSIWKEITNLMPHESTIYLADSKNAPYGNKTAAEILQLSIKNTEKLISLKVKIIVVACNTATTNAIDYLRKHYSIPFIGIEPAIKPAALQSKTKTIGVLATKGTLNSKLFAQTSEKYTSNHKVIEVFGEGLVPLIEQGCLQEVQTKTLVQSYINPMLEAGIDHLVLGCSHYPYLLQLLKELLPDHIQIIDSGEAVARQTKQVLDQQQTLDTTSTPQHYMYSNTNTKVLEYLLSTQEQKINFSYLDF